MFALVAAPPARAGGDHICESMGKGGKNKLEVCLWVSWNDANHHQISNVHFTHQVLPKERGGDGRADNSRLVYTVIVEKDGGKTFPSRSRTFSSRTGYVTRTARTEVGNCSQFYNGDLFNMSIDWYTPCHDLGANGHVLMRVERYTAGGAKIDDFRTSAVRIVQPLK
jgi:hypothetical protein